MSKEKCEEVRADIVKLINTANSGALGQGKGVSMAITHLEDAHMRLRYHMNQMGWLQGATNAALNTEKSTPVAAPVTKPVVKSKLTTPTGIRTGLMNPQNVAPASNAPVAQKAVTQSRTPRTKPALSDVGLLD